MLIVAQGRDGTLPHHLFKAGIRKTMHSRRHHPFQLIPFRFVHSSPQELRIPDSRCIVFASKSTVCHSSPILTNLPFHDFPKMVNHESWFN
jgi:hypothetical protein